MEMRDACAEQKQFVKAAVEDDHWIFVTAGFLCPVRVGMQYFHRELLLGRPRIDSVRNVKARKQPGSSEECREKYLHLLRDDERSMHTSAVQRCTCVRTLTG